MNEDIDIIVRATKVLTSYQVFVFYLLLQGFTITEIAKKLYCSRQAISKLIKTIVCKLKVEAERLTGEKLPGFDIQLYREYMGLQDVYVCKGCGIEFKPITRNQKWHSHECKISYRKGRSTDNVINPRGILKYSR